MLKKSLRLLGPISKKSKSLSTDLFLIKYIDNGLSQSRFGFLISKKTENSAVKRNRAKRLIRSCIEENSVNIKKGYDFLFILKRNIISKQRAEINDFLILSLKEIKLYE